MKLRLALDALTLEECMTLLQKTRGSVGIAGMGTSFVIKEGMRPVREFKQHFPEIEILADVKIMGAGELEAEVALKVGADIVTVLGVSNDETILGAVKAAKKHSGKIMIGMITVRRFES